MVGHLAPLHRKYTQSRESSQTWAMSDSRHVVKVDELPGIVNEHDVLGLDISVYKAALR